MKSIQTKIITLITAGLVIMALLLGSYSMYVVETVSDEDAEIMMNEACNKQALRLDSQLKLVEQSVDIIHEYSQELLEKSAVKNGKLFLDNYSKDVENLAVNIAENTDGAITVYFRFNPELYGDGNGGFFWRRDNLNSGFNKAKNTDILKYDSSDNEHVGWYYEPVNSGKAVWMVPYLNKNINLYMISYSVPVYYDGQLIGIIGMDVAFKQFVEIAQDMSLYHTGDARLISMEDKTAYYHNPVMADDKDALNVHKRTVPENVYELMEEEDSTDKLKSLSVNNIDCKIAYRTIRNNMKLLVYAPEYEVYAYRNNMFKGSLFLMSIMVLIMIVVSFVITRKIISPLKALTDASEKIARGEWDISVTCDTKDEVKRLTDSIIKMADITKKNMEELSQIAFRDVLTGVGNKTSYINHISQLDSKEIKEESEYALIVLDINNLKKVNDIYGHEVGDELIKAAGKKICSIFRGKSIFRIGGDEFVVILEKDDFVSRQDIEERINDNLFIEFEYRAQHIACSIAHGICLHPEDGETFEEVFKKADKKMYTNKKAMKEVESR